MTPCLPSLPPPQNIAKHFNDRLTTKTLRTVFMDMMRSMCNSDMKGNKMVSELKPEIVASLAAAAAAGGGGGEQA